MTGDTPTIRDLVASIPASPVDLWQITMWQASESIGAIGTLTFSYHVNTPYGREFPDQGLGAPIVDQWLIYGAKDRCLGRLDGWSRLAPWITERSEESGLLNRYFADAESAREGLKKALLGKAAKLQREVDDIGDKIRRLETGK